MSKIVTGIGCILFACSMGFAAEKDIEQAYHKLSSARFFAFGGVGFAGSTSEGEKAYGEICASSEALPLFKAALTNENPCTKLYALCGVRRLEPKSFDKLARPLAEANPPVRVMSGCILSEEGASNIIARIKRGAYDAERKIQR